jgi:hypothetical protein
MCRNLASVAAALFIVGCVTHQSHVIVGTVRPAISPDAVKIYLTPPPSYEQVAIIDASSAGSMAVGDQKKTDIVIARLKEEAAKLGANGILLEGTGNQSAGSVGFGSATASSYGHSAFGTGVGFSGPIMLKTGNGTAIYVPEQ